jgi:ketosteroid isomerase-like protein
MTEIGKQIIALDRQRMTAMTRKDTATLNALLSDDLVYTHAMGRLDTKQGLIADIESRSVVFETMEPFDVKAQDFGNVVVLTGLTRTCVARGDKRYEISTRFTDVWANKNGDWRMVTWQATICPNE